VRQRLRQRHRAHDADLIAEHNDRMHACYEDHGVTVTRAGDDRWTLDNGGDVDLLIQISKECADEVGPPPIRPPDEIDARHMYDLALRQAQCLRDLGLDVSEPPSRESWVDTFLAGDPPWTPYDGRTMPESALTTCPDPQLQDLVVFETAPPT
jgi:hypothetical protein